MKEKQVLLKPDYELDAIKSAIFDFYGQTQNAFVWAFNLTRDVDYGDNLSSGDRTGFLNWNQMDKNGTVRATVRYTIGVETRSIASAIGLAESNFVQDRIDAMNELIDHCKVVRTARLTVVDSVVFGIAQQTHSNLWVVELVFDIESFLGL